KRANTANQTKQLSTTNNDVIGEKEEEAAYAPPIRLLTEFDPFKAPEQYEQQQQQVHVNSSDDEFIRGATGYVSKKDGKQSGEPVASSSALTALKMHNDMLRKPPNDGMIRVRMYYHQAIHDDPRRYGHGPWKYWGHGWGVEYGIDPHKRKEYERGYTIEKGFGRDFCAQPSSHCHRSHSPSHSAQFAIDQHALQSRGPIFINSHHQHMM
ncbi:hypothetical protein GZH46_00971, partial [Fragariocoptes setiger]